MEFLEPITLAAPHIYLSALPFAPQASKVSVHFLKHFQKTLTVKMGQMEDWSEKCFIKLGDHDGRVGSVAFYPDGRHIVSGSYDKPVRVWDAQAGQSVMDPLKGHDCYVTSVTFSPDGWHIASGSSDKTVRVWDAQAGQSVTDPHKGYDNWVTSVAFSSDGSHIISGSHNKTVRVWDGQIGQSVMDTLKGHDGHVTSVAFSSHGKHIVSGSHDKIVRVWDAQTDQTIMDHFTTSCLSTCSTSSIAVALPILPIHAEDGSKIDLSDSYKTFFCCCHDIPFLKFCHRNDNWVMLPDHRYLLWVPDQNKSGLFWPRTTTVIGCTPTSLQFKNFVYGIHWSQCFSSLHDPI